MDNQFFVGDTPKIYLADHPRFLSRMQKYMQKLEELYGEKLSLPVRMFFVRDKRTFNDFVHPNPNVAALHLKVAYFHDLYFVQPDSLERNAKISNSVTPFWSSVGHELQHCFYIAIAKIDAPMWLNEGLSVTLFPENYGQASREDVSRVLGFFNEFPPEKINYAAAQRIVGALIAKFGKAKIFGLVKAMRDMIKSQKLTIFDRGHFAHCFSQVYGIPFDREQITDIICK